MVECAFASTHVSSPKLTSPRDEESLSISTGTLRGHEGGLSKWLVMALVVLALVGIGWGLWLTLRG